MFRCGEFTMPLGKKTYVMAILNYTPDSFSDGGKFNTPETALQKAVDAEKQGADILDIGAQSTRPGSETLTHAEELKRLEEVFSAIKGRVSVPVSVDTFYPECAEFALENGAVIINDVSGKMNEDMVRLAKKYGAGYIVTHNPSSASEQAEYPDGALIAVRSFFLECLEKAHALDLNRSSLCLDPGFGFGKSRENDYEILKGLNLLKFTGTALLAGVSRKRMTDPDGLFAPEERELETTAANTLAIAGGADIIRVHNVPNAVRAAAFADRALRRA